MDYRKVKKQFQLCTAGLTRRSSHKSLKVPGLTQNSFKCSCALCKRHGWVFSSNR